MVESTVFPLRAFPRKLIRSLVMFAAAGTLMAALVWSDGMGRPWVPAFILVICWAVPVIFAYQIRRGGFDPLQRFVVTEAGLEAHFRDGAHHFLAWEGITRLVAVSAFRNRAWAIASPQGTVRWFGELEQPDAFASLVAERTGKTWEALSTYPEDVFGPAARLDAET